MVDVIFHDIGFEKDFWCETKYIDNIISILKNKLEDDYSIVVTPNLKMLPITKFKKIVIVTGDELGRLGLNPYPNSNDIVAIFRIFNRTHTYNDTNVFPIPTGYNWAMHNSDKKMIKMYSEKKLSERKYDIFYSGQVLPSRRIVVDKLKNLSSEFNILSNVNKSFRIGMEIDDYYKVLGDTKIALAPDGTSVDKFRYIEALGSGCVVITTNKDDIWYYKKSPAYFINSWNELSNELIRNILNSNLDDKYYENLKYYNEKLSEEAVANYILKKIN